MDSWTHGLMDSWTHGLMDSIAFWCHVIHDARDRDGAEAGEGASKKMGLKD